MILSSQNQTPLPRYRSHKEVWALKIAKVVKHAHPEPQADDAAFEASAEFQGAHLFPAEPGFAPIPVDAAWYRKHDPEPGGYFIQYADGYTSFSPAGPFEEGYTRIYHSAGLTFGDAIAALRSGLRVERDGWNGRGMWLALVGDWSIYTPMATGGAHVAPFIAMKTADNRLVPWLASQTDMLACDWRILR